MARVLERFKARSDDGKYEATIIVVQEMIDAASHDYPNATIPGLKTARTITGLSCSPIDDNAFKVFDPKHPHEIIVRRLA